jgi:hypothetical protein
LLAGYYFGKDFFDFSETLRKVRCKELRDFGFWYGRIQSENLDNACIFCQALPLIILGFI